jgi:hypothetical protein
MPGVIMPAGGQEIAELALERARIKDAHRDVASKNNGVVAEGRRWTPDTGISHRKWVTHMAACEAGWKAQGKKFTPIVRDIEIDSDYSDTEEMDMEVSPRKGSIGMSDETKETLMRYFEDGWKAQGMNHHFNSAGRIVDERGLLLVRA